MHTRPGLKWFGSVGLFVCMSFVIVVIFVAGRESYFLRLPLLCGHHGNVGERDAVWTVCTSPHCLPCWVSVCVCVCECVCACVVCVWVYMDRV